MRNLAPLMTLALLWTMPLAAAQGSATVDACFAAECTRICPGDVRDGELLVPGVDAGLPAIEADVPTQEAEVPGSSLFVPGFFLEVGDDRVVDSPHQHADMPGSTLRIGGHERYDPAEGRRIAYGGVEACLLTNG